MLETGKESSILELVGEASKRSTQMLTFFDLLATRTVLTGQTEAESETVKQLEKNTKFTKTRQTSLVKL